MIRAIKTVREWGYAAREARREPHPRSINRINSIDRADKLNDEAPPHHLVFM